MTVDQITRIVNIMREGMNEARGVKVIEVYGNHNRKAVVVEFPFDSRDEQAYTNTCEPDPREGRRG